MSAVADLVESITIESRFLPAFTIDRPFAEGGTPNPFVKLMQPRITIKTGLGDTTNAPYGDPDPNLWPQVQLAGVVLLGGVAVLLAWRFTR